MPLNTAGLQSALQTAFKDNLPSTTPTQEAQIAHLAEKITTAIKAFIESATITYVAGLTTAPGGGPVTGIFTNTIS